MIVAALLMISSGTKASAAGGALLLLVAVIMLIVSNKGNVQPDYPPQTVTKPIIIHKPAPDPIKIAEEKERLQVRRELLRAGSTPLDQSQNGQLLRPATSEEKHPQHLLRPID